MGRYRQSLGAFGEQVAVRFLHDCGHQVLDRNYRVPAGEIDIVSVVGDELVITEVKTRTGTQFGYPEESVTPRKLRTMSRVGHQWWRTHAHTMPRRRVSMRLDVVAILLDSHGCPQITHVENVHP